MRLHHFLSFFLSLTSLPCWIPLLGTEWVSKHPLIYYSFLLFSFKSLNKISIFVQIILVRGIYRLSFYTSSTEFFLLKTRLPEQPKQRLKEDFSVIKVFPFSSEKISYLKFISFSGNWYLYAFWNLSSIEEKKNLDLPLPRSDTDQVTRFATRTAGCTVGKK